jgi:hypothetical protein
MEKQVVFVYGKKALIGVFSPISFLTEANLQRAISCLKNDSCDFVYIALDHLDAENKQRAEEYLNGYVRNLALNLQTKIFISASSKSYAEMFAEYVRQIPGQTSVSIFARIDEKYCIKGEIIATLNKLWLTDDTNPALVFMH